MYKCDAKERESANMVQIIVLPVDKVCNPFCRYRGMHANSIELSRIFISVCIFVCACMNILNLFACEYLFMSQRFANFH